MSIKVIDKKEDREMQEHIESRAQYSLFILGKAFITRGSGKFLRLCPSPIRMPKRKK